MKEITGEIGTRHIGGNAQILQTIKGSLSKASGGKKEIISNTTEAWNSNPSLVSSKDIIYVYTDYAQRDGQLVPNFKIGDGLAYLIDLPFAIPDETIITPEQIDFWNNKVAVRVDPLDPEHIIFYTGDS